MRSMDSREYSDNTVPLAIQVAQLIVHENVVIVKGLVDHLVLCLIHHRDWDGYQAQEGPLDSLHVTQGVVTQK